MNNETLSHVSKCPMHKLDKTAHSIYSSFTRKLKRKYADGEIRKALHTKTIAVVKATVKVRPSLPPFLKKGLFEEEREYKALIRFSNASSSVSKDINPSVRGMAIKIYIDNGEQDILLATNKIHFPVKIWLQKFIPYIAFAKKAGQILLGILIAILSLSFRKAFQFRRGIIKAANLLEEPYFSATPFSFGSKNAIKWHALPFKKRETDLPTYPNENFLQNKLRYDLSPNYPHSVGFGLYVQFQENEKAEPIEDTSVEWKTAFHQVAIITIPKQEVLPIDNQLQDIVVNFSPDNTISAHKPLGKINYLRSIVYKKLAKDRIK